MKDYLKKELNEKFASCSNTDRRVPKDGNVELTLGKFKGSNITFRFPLHKARVLIDGVF